MTRYIVRPRSVHAPVSLSSTTLTSDARFAQFKNIVELRTHDPAIQALTRWIDKTLAPKMSKNQFNPVTGTMVLDMEQDDAERLKRDFDPPPLVIPDQYIDLIQPGLATNGSGVDISNLWHLDAIGLSAARGSGFSGTGEGVTVAVLDTGIQAGHVEFSGKSIDMVTFDVNSWRHWKTQPSMDTTGHGTHVAGLLAGNNVGVAPGVSLVNAMMIPNGRGQLSDFVLSLEWAASQPEISIVNLSAGIRGFVDGMEEIVEGLLDVGVLPVVAVGNEGRNRTRSPGNYRSVLSVGACDENGAVPSFSSSGTLTVDNHNYQVPVLVAPGKAVISCVMGGGYEAWSGTSMATPIVSAIAALILESHPLISILDLIDSIFDKCSKLNVVAERQGAGRAQV